MTVLTGPEVRSVQPIRRGKSETFYWSTTVLPP